MQDEVYDVLAKNEQQHWWSVGRRTILHSILTSMNLPKNASILEVGAGTGGNISMLQDFGQVNVLEGNPSGLKYLKDRKDVPIIEGYLPDTSMLGDQQFDVIVLFDVLEHIENDREALIALKKHLKEDGQMLFSVPAFPMLWSNHDVINYHFRRYTKSTLAPAFSDAGLNVKRMSYFNFFLFPAIAAVRGLFNLFKIKGHDQETMPGPFINGFLTKLFASESYLLKAFNLPFGVSLFAIVDKKSTK
jgi:SAM-dependent methyltransferase